jgi:uncharacterized membrane protein
MNKKGASFGTIIAVIGSILIALGIAWLIAQNWHQMPSPLKIIILLLVTASAYFSGTLLRIKNYEGIGKALLVLGALLYTLSIFLIAQIFSTNVTAQGTAWLLLLAWIGVFITAYIFQSSASLLIALIEFLIWIIIQFFAFYENTRNAISPGILAFYLLIIGVLWYGLSLWHKAKEHDFAKLYQWWTVFYFLAFTYILSFQMLLPILWPKQAVITSAHIIFLIVISILSVIVLSSGITFVINNNSVPKKEILGMAAIVLILIVLIGLTAFTSDKIGNCNEKTCYDNKNQEECQSALKDLNCGWNNNRCSVKNCRDFKTETTCKGEESIACDWNNNVCNKLRCFDYKDQTECESLPENSKCMWANKGCVDENCYGYTTQDKCETNNLECKWERNRCEGYDSCEEYTNNYEQCSQENKCKWRATNFNYRRNKNIPLIIWAIWIIINVAFIIIILSFIAYGSWLKIPEIINLAIVFFALNIITRYIGFIMNLWGYTSLSVIFITGGLVLVIGGWLIEKWRRNLIDQTKTGKLRG